MGWESKLGLWVNVLQHGLLFGVYGTRISLVKSKTEQLIESRWGHPGGCFIWMK